MLAWLAAVPDWETLKTVYMSQTLHAQPQVLVASAGADADAPDGSRLGACFCCLLGCVRPQACMQPPPDKGLLHQMPSMKLLTPGPEIPRGIECGPSGGHGEHLFTPLPIGLAARAFELRSIDHLLVTGHMQASGALETMHVSPSTWPVRLVKTSDAPGARLAGST